MLNREEVLYNVKSLVSTWLFGKNEVTNLKIEMVGDDDTITHPVELSVCCDKICELLCENGTRYNFLRLYGDVDGKCEIIGNIDIL